jgi:hypothetical protein
MPLRFHTHSPDCVLVSLAEAFRLEAAGLKHEVAVCVVVVVGLHQLGSRRHALRRLCGFADLQRGPIAGKEVARRESTRGHDRRERTACVTLHEHALSLPIVTDSDCCLSSCDGQSAIHRPSPTAFTPTSLSNTRSTAGAVATERAIRISRDAQARRRQKAEADRSNRERAN